MRRFLSVAGIVVAAFGILWILRGTNVISSGFMAGQMQYALLGAVVVIAGIGLIAFANRRGAGIAGPGKR
jgi:hypothetical protein